MNEKTGEGRQGIGPERARRRMRNKVLKGEILYSLRIHLSLECFVHDSRSRLVKHNCDHESNHAHSGRVNH